MISVYTDGSCLKNPGGVGGWGFCYEHLRIIERYNGGATNTTNNRMELTAVIEAVKHFSHNIPLKIHSDSQYAIGVLSGKWVANKNQDLVLPFRELAKAYRLEWQWVRGHNGDVMNEIADELAGNAARAIKATLKTS